ncbi:MAG: ROK family protein [Lachnospiraceae bacterium]|nr:ROK family protein [Ruminococcus sp.]MCM1274310.1 ROK family protein [Lachnospiraceae bacterium]
MYNIGIDLGGTNIKVGLVDENYSIVAKATAPTSLPRPAEEIVKAMVDTMWKALNEAKVTIGEVNSIGIGTPGVANRNSGMVLYSCNLGFNNTDLRALFKKFLDKPLYVENDANAAAFGEVLAGAAKGCKDVVVVTLGTGVGGGIIVDGKIYTGFNFCGAELGHTVIEYNGRQCGCGRRGCFEAYSSATALINMTKEAMEADKNSKMWELAGGSLDNVDGKTAFDGMRAGDGAAKGVVDMYIEYLGCGLTNIVNTFQPEVLLIGGGICKEGENLTKPLQEIITRDSYCIDPEKSTRLGIAELGNDAGIIGAAFLYTIAE